MTDPEASPAAPTPAARPAPKGRVLFVDDEQKVLDALRLNLKRRYDVHLAPGPREALEKITSEGPFHVVVSDFKMPGMNGVELLTRVKAVSPKSVRVMLTGHADMDVAIDAVNSGSVFRFLTKPCSMDQLTTAVDAALEQNRLLNLEKDLLRNTLLGSVSVIVEILSMVNPQAFGRSDRIRRLVTGLAKEMKLPGASKYELAALLSQLGCVTVPNDILTKRYSGLQLDPEEQHAFDLGIRTASTLIKKIPRMEEVADIILCQLDSPEAGIEGTLGARLLLLALDYDDLLLAGKTQQQALDALSERPTRYGAPLLAALEALVAGEDCRQIRDVRLPGLAPGMILAADLRAVDGTLMLSRGLAITEFILERLHSLSAIVPIHEPIRVYEGQSKACPPPPGAR
ncbi:Hydrogenase transcriptional regulatory protein hupR1 [Fundidesulfovibrio magnetotacticus]|uniref:Hydrogenase transcriptional regulatory protein hupR1 n=1 Tax=Fundidesulfovibrio magnetotacticus TaxID=2730080 RepID=A0A6V8LRV5_9BACT|nr:HD domain-containing phosphohydrolase [Fundidesulfovibrio magnetotacticus]GFK92849.1 Hydrogenase transcriptional regulatory protein hupR1 [Fundidesulfovibrio magnetotacticus]